MGHGDRRLGLEQEVEQLLAFRHRAALDDEHRLHPAVAVRRIEESDVVAFLAQPRDTARPSGADVHLLLDKQAHQLGARRPVLENLLAVFAHLIPQRVHVLNVVRVLTGPQRSEPDLLAPVGVAANLAFPLRVDQHLRAHLVCIVVGDVLAVPGEAGGAVVVGRCRQPLGSDLAERASSAIPSPASGWGHCPR